MDSFNVAQEAENTSEQSNFFTPNERTALRLLKLCRAPGVPLFFFDKIMKILKKGKDEGGNFNDPSFLNFTSQKLTTFIRKAVRINPPTRSQIAIETSENQNIGIHHIPRGSISVPNMNFEEMLYNLIGDMNIFGNKNNLVVNDINVWDQKNFGYNHPGEILQAEACQQYIRDKKLVEGLDLLIPIILYQDSITTTANQRFSVNPVLFTLGIIKYSKRRHESSARLLGIIPSFDRRTKSQKLADGNGNEISKGRHCRNYHACHAVLLQQIYNVQKKLKKQRILIRLGNETRSVYLHIPVVFFSGDAMSSDLLACRYASYVNSIRLSRGCNIGSEEADIPGKKCTPISTTDVKTHVTRLLEDNEHTTPSEKKESKDFLKSICTHKCHNSIWDVQTVDKTFLPLPHDCMHIYSTLMKTTFSLLIAPLTPKEKADLDIAVEQMFGELKSGETQNFPRFFFSSGVTNVKNLTSREWVGTLILSLMLLRSPKGKSILKGCLQRGNGNGKKQKKQKKKKAKENTLGTQTKYDKDGDVIEIAPSNPVTFDEAIEVLEELLLLYAYTEYGSLYSDFDKNDPNSFHYWKGQESETILRKRIKYLQEILVSRFPRNAGCGWKLQKFHELLHFASDITKFGHSYNFNCSYFERFLKEFGKNPSKTVRKIHSDRYTNNIATRYYDHFILDQLFQRTELKYDTDMDDGYDTDMDIGDNQQGETLNGTEHSPWKIKQKYAQWTINSGKCVSRYSNFEMPQVIFESISKEVLVNMDIPRPLHGYTEIDILDDRYGKYVRLKCHPNLNGKAWFDWCLIDYSEYFKTDKSCERIDVRQRNASRNFAGTTPPGYYPSKLLAVIINPFFDCTKPEHPTKNPKVQCLVHMTTKMMDETKLTETWKLEYKTKKLHLPPMDDNLNILNHGSRETRQKVPVLRLVSAASIKRRILVMETFPTLRSFIDTSKNSHHSDIVVYLRDMKKYWSDTYISLLK